MNTIIKIVKNNHATVDIVDSIVNTGKLASEGKGNSHVVRVPADNPSVLSRIEDEITKLVHIDDANAPSKYDMYVEIEIDDNYNNKVHNAKAIVEVENGLFVAHVLYDNDLYFIGTTTPEFYADKLKQYELVDGDCYTTNFAGGQWNDDFGMCHYPWLTIAEYACKVIDGEVDPYRRDYFIEKIKQNFLDGERFEYVEDYMYEIIAHITRPREVGEDLAVFNKRVKLKQDIEKIRELQKQLDNLAQNLYI